MSSLETDVLIIGAGPAGSSAASLLAVKGINVTLIDQSNFPRGKTCGGGLVTDSLQALRRLGLLENVIQSALPIRELIIFSPNRSEISLQGDFASLSRYLLDDILRTNAVTHGARFYSPYLFFVLKICVNPINISE